MDRWFSTSRWMRTEIRIPRTPIDITGQRYGKLVALNPEQSRDRHAYWLCRCDCGAEVVARGSKLRDGTTTSCPACGYRRDSERHAVARRLVTAEDRSRIGKLGAIARHGGRKDPE